MTKPMVLYIPPQSHTELVFTPQTLERFRQAFDVTFNETGRNFSTKEVAEMIKGYDALVTGWGSPPLSEQVFEKADKLKIIAHSAGSVKFLFSGDLIERYVKPRGITIFSANHAIAFNVAESTIGLLIMMSRRWLDHALAYRERGVWRDQQIPSNGQYLMGSTVGIVSASKVGREVIRLLKAFYEVRILLYDPYVSEEDAKALGVELVSLEDLFARSNFVSVHAPLIPATVGLINAKHLKLMKDGAVLINTARGKIINHDDLLQELKTGRIFAALDVTDPEPLPPDHPFRTLPNVVILPHISGAGFYGYHKIGEMTVKALEDFFAGLAVSGAVPLEYYDLIA